MTGLTSKKLIIIAVIVSVVILFQTCIRYEYHIVGKGLGTVRIDRLTGKTKLIKNLPEQKKQDNTQSYNDPNSLLYGYKE